MIITVTTKQNEHYFCCRYLNHCLNPASPTCSAPLPPIGHFVLRSSFCSVLRWAAVWCCCSVLQYVAVCCSVLQCVAVCCSYSRFCSDLRADMLKTRLLRLHFRHKLHQSEQGSRCSVVQCGAVWCSVLQLQWVWR